MPRGPMGVPPRGFVPPADAGIRYLTLAELAAEMGITAEALRQARQRHPAGKPGAFPAPDGKIGHALGWLPETVPACRQWLRRNRETRSYAVLTPAQKTEIRAAWADRETTGVTQKQLAERYGVNRTTIVNVTGDGGKARAARSYAAKRAAGRAGRTR